MSAKRNPVQIEVHELGQRRLYVKTSTGFVLHDDDFTPEELLAIATDIARLEHEVAPQIGKPNTVPPPERRLNQAYTRQLPIRGQGLSAQ